jgi:hypothetical protein
LALNTAYQQFAANFAQAVMSKNFAAAHDLLAPWLQQTLSPERLAELIRAEVSLTLAANELEGDFHPQAYEIGWNNCQLTNLLEPRSYAPPREIAAEVTPNNFCQWMKIQLLK